MCNGRFVVGSDLLFYKVGQAIEIPNCCSLDMTGPTLDVMDVSYRKTRSRIDDHSLSFHLILLLNECVLSIVIYI